VQPWAPRYQPATGGDRGAGDVTNMNLTIYSQATTEQVAGDFEIMRALAGA